MHVDILESENANLKNENYELNDEKCQTSRLQLQEHDVKLKCALGMVMKMVQVENRFR